MSIKTAIASALVALTAAGSLLPMASAANARDFDRGGNGGYSDFKSGGKHGHVNRGWRGHDRGNDYAYRDYGYRRHRDHTGRNLAIGAFATILGIAIASEVNRDRHGY